MALPKFSVTRPITTLMIFLGLGVMGLISFLKLPVELMPNVSSRKVTIYVGVRGGMPPEEVESMVTRPIEEAVGTISSLKSIRSVSRKERSEVVLEFEAGTNMDFASLEVREKFARIKHKLPKDIERPVIANYEETDRPVISLSVKSEKMSLPELKSLVDVSVKDDLSRVEGVANVKTVGGGSDQRKIFIEMSLNKLQNYGISTDEVTSAIANHNKSFAVGYIERQDNRMMIRAIGQYTSLEEIGLTIVKASQDEAAIVRIKDIAVIMDSSLEPESLSRINGENVVSIHVQRESDANTVKVVDNVKDILEEFKDRYAEKGIIIEENSNLADFIKEAIGSVKMSLFYGGILTLIIIYVFLKDLPTTLAVAFSIPTSVIITFSCMYFQHLSINVWTLSGLALGIGMLIDNSIVVLDNIHRVHKGLKNKIRSSIEGSEEMILAIIASTLTTVIVFLPIVFVSKELQLLYSSFALTVVYSLFASLFVALTLVPCYVSLTLKEPGESLNDKSKRAVIKHLGIGNLRQKLSGSISRFYQNMGFARIKKFFAWKPMAVSLTLGKLKKFRGRLSLYHKLLFTAVRYRYYYVGAVLVVFVIALVLLKGLDRTLMGSTDEGTFTMFAELDSGAKLDISDEMVKEIETVLDAIPEIKNFSSDVEPTSSRIYVTLVPLKERDKSTQEIIDELRVETDEIETSYKGGFIYYSEQQSSGSGKEVQIDIFGHNYDVLKELAISIASRVSTVKGIEDPKMARLQGRPELRLFVDKVKASYLGFTTGEIASAVHGQLRGYRASTLASEHFDIGGNEVEIVTRLKNEDRDTFDAIGRLSMTQNYEDREQKQIFLRQMVDYSFGIGPSEIFRKNKHRMFHVSANIGDNPLGRIVNDIKENLKDLKMPKEYYYEFGEEYKRMLKNQREMTIAAALTLLLVYMVLASLFESYYQPFIIMFSVILAAIGAIFFLYFFKISISLGVMMGTTMLFGIVVNNGIMMIDHINRLREKNKGDFRKWVVRGALDRRRPIMMTSLSTIGGMIPMALDRGSGASLWSPLAITVIGGMISGTFLTLLIVPCIYIIFEDIKKIASNLAKRIGCAVAGDKYYIETDAV